MRLFLFSFALVLLSQALASPALKPVALDFGSGVKVVLPTGTQVHKLPTLDLWALEIPTGADGDFRHASIGSLQLVHPKELGIFSFAQKLWTSKSARKSASGNTVVDFGCERQGVVFTTCSREGLSADGSIWVESLQWNGKNQLLVRVNSRSADLNAKAALRDWVRRVWLEVQQ